MIGQYLSNTNKKATVSILQNILELNKAWLDWRRREREGRRERQQEYSDGSCFNFDRV